MSGYKTYRFKDKDPVIDLLRTAIQVAGVSYQEVADGIGMSASTLYAWFHGETRRPQHASVQAVARFLHKEFRLMDAKKS